MNKEDLEQFIINDKEIVYSLEECLNVASDANLACISLAYSYKLGLEFLTLRSEQIKIVLNNYERIFKEIFETNEHIKEINIIKNAYDNDTNIIEDASLELLSLGFLFAFRKNNKITYVIPDEIFQIYEEFFNDERKQINLEYASKSIMGYIAMNGIIPIEILNDILINNYKLDITKREIREIALDQGNRVYKGKYLTMIDPFEEKNIKYLLKFKKDNSYKIVSLEKVIEYDDFYQSFINSLERILGKYYDILILKIYIVVSTSYNEYSEQLKELFEANDISKDKETKIFKAINKRLPEFRLWGYNGRTENEIQFDSLKIDYLIKKPKNTDLKTCLQSLNKELLKDIINENDCNNIDELVNIMLESINSYVETLETEELVKCLDLKNKDINKIIEDDYPLDFFNYLFYYLDKDKNQRIIIPDEIYDSCMNEITLDSEYSESDDLIIFSYVKMNGIIKKDELQKILKEYHDMNYSIKELDSKVIDFGFDIFKEYYTYFQGMPEGHIKMFLERKKLNKPKKYDRIQIEKTDEYFSKVDALIKTLKLSKDRAKVLKSSLIISSETHGIDNGAANALKEIYPELTKKFLDELQKLFNSYKDYIYCWLYNGYSFGEIEKTINKKVKVGRNEPCPCGSGKKYKHCCGK